MTSKDKIVLIGSGGHAVSCASVIRSIGCWKIAGYLDSRGNSDLEKLGVPYLGTDDEIKPLITENYAFHIAIGYLNTEDDTRKRIHSFLKEHNARLPTLISPHAFLDPSAKIGDGTIIMHGAIINAFAEIGDCCIINSLCLVEHHAKVSSYCHLATRSTVNGGVTIGPSTLVGSSATILQGRKIASNCTLAAGTVICRDTLPGRVYKGIPGKSLSDS